ncbi:MAG: hypothetical protein BJ554DRAFT_1837, partial [Olpidium bornovanus]
GPILQSKINTNLATLSEVTLSVPALIFNETSAPVITGTSASLPSPLALAGQFFNATSSQPFSKAGLICIDQPRGFVNKARPDNRERGRYRSARTGCISGGGRPRHRGHP